MPSYLNANTFIFFRIIGATSLFLIIKSFVKEKVAKQDLLLLALCGLFGIAANQLLFFHGLSRTSPLDSAIIMVTTPVLVTIFSLIILKNKLTTLKVSGVLIGLTGAILLIYLGASDTNRESSLLGNLFVMLNATSYSIYLVIVKPLMKKYKPITVITYIFSFGALYVIPFGLYSISDNNFEFTTSVWLSVGFVIFFTTFTTYLLNIYALKKLSSTVTASYIYLQPVFVMLLGVLIYNSKNNSIIGWQKITATLLIFLGVYLVSKTGNKQASN